MNRSLIKLDPSSNPSSVLGNGVVIALVVDSPLALYEDGAVLVVSVEAMFLFGLALRSMANPDARAAEETAKAEFVGLSKISIPCCVIEANLCLSIRTSSSRSRILLQTDCNSDKNRTKIQSFFYTCFRG